MGHALSLFSFDGRRLYRQSNSRPGDRCAQRQIIPRRTGKIKGMTAKVLREEFPHLKSRLPNLWTRSYFVASTGGVTLQVLKEYVESQKGV